MITSNGLTRLSKRASESRRHLADLFEKSAVRIDSAVAWGQFLDAPRKAGQFGVYGTSAAIQVLSAFGHTPNSPLLSKALAALPEVEPRGENESLYDSTDLSITFKEAAILDAAQPGQAQFSYQESIETILLSQLIDGHGWGNYYDPSDQDDSPRLLPTAHALIALRRSREFRTSKQCEAILTWLCEYANSDGPALIHEAALALLALIEYQSPGITLPPYQTARQRLLDQVARWAQDRHTNTIGEIASYHYWALNQGNQHNHYMFYVPDLLVALALLRAGNPRPTRRKILHLMDILCTEIAAQGGYRAKASQRIATVDQLWAYRLLEEFSARFAVSPAKLMPPAAYLVSASPARRLGTALALFALGALGTLVTILDWLNVILRVTGGVLATVSLGLLASFLFVWLRGD
jgi:hypothetical protein